MVLAPPDKINSERWMARLTKRLILAIETVVDIAYNASKFPVQAKDISVRQNVSKHYLKPILQQLVHSGILLGVRGASGGYRLSRSRRQITLGDITRVVEKMENPKAMLDDVARSTLGQIVLGPLWQEINNTAISRLDSISIEDVCRRAHEQKVRPPKAPQFEFMR